MKVVIELDVNDIEAKYLSGSKLRKKNFEPDDFDPCELDLIYEFTNADKVLGTLQIKDDLNEKRLLIFFNDVKSLEADIDITVNDVQFCQKFKGQISEYGNESKTEADANDFEIIVLLLDIKEQIKSVRGQVSVNFLSAIEDL